MSLHEARYWEPAGDGRVVCHLCPHTCRISLGRVGACGVRANADGRLVTLVYDRVVAQELDPIEKKPLFHFLPGSTAWSVATAGCNLHCSYCQNWTISQWGHSVGRMARRANAVESVDALARRVPGVPATPEGIVRDALAVGAQSIAYTYTEPTIFYELALDTCVLAHEAGLRNVFVTNGFIEEPPLRALVPYLDAANVDLKFFTEDGYRRISRASLAPVLHTIRRLHELGVWVEVTTLVIPGLNDSDAELRGIADFLVRLDPDIPWHLSRFFPAWRMQDRPRTPLDTLQRARDLGREAGLRYVYVGNVPSHVDERTRCPACDAPVVERSGSQLVENRIRDGGCPVCGHPIPGVGMSLPAPPPSRPRPVPTGRARA